MARVGLILQWLGQRPHVGRPGKLNRHCRPSDYPPAIRVDAHGSPSLIREVKPDHLALLRLRCSQMHPMFGALEYRFGGIARLQLVELALGGRLTPSVKLS